MKLIKQRKDVDCAIAAMAMFADVSYETAIEWSKGVYTDEIGLTGNQIKAILEKVGFLPVFMHGYSYNNPAILIIPKPTRENMWEQHAIAIEDGKVYDPARTGIVETLKGCWWAFAIQCAKNKEVRKVMREEIRESMEKLEEIEDKL